MASNGYAVTLGEATMQVGVSRRTLAKWMLRLDIESARHPVDYRYRTISEEAVQRITATRDELPWRQQQSSANRGHNMTNNIPRQPTNAHAIPLPDGWLALSTWCALHHLHGQSVRRAIGHGQLPAPQEGRWQHGPMRNTVLHAYAPEQHEKADALAVMLWPQRFMRC